MNYGKILAQLRKEKRMTQPEVAEFISEHSDKQYTNKAISHWEKGVTAPPVEQFLLLCELYSVRDIQFTFRGIESENKNISKLNNLGMKKVEDYIAVLSGNPLFTELEKPLENSSTSIIKLYNVPAAAGDGFYLDDDSYEEIEVDETVACRADYAIRIGGDSMMPRFVDGQLVFIKEQKLIEVGEIGVFALNGLSFIKKLGRGELISINPKYAPIPIREFDSLYVLGKVLS